MITGLYAALLGLMLIFLSIQVIRGRYRAQAALGDRGDVELLRRQRAQGNLTEYAPIFLLLLFFAEAQGLPVFWLHLLGLVFIGGRIFHAYGLLKAESYNEGFSNGQYRMVGMLSTFGCITALSLILLIRYGQGM